MCIWMFICVCVCAYVCARTCLKRPKVNVGFFLDDSTFFIKADLSIGPVTH